jgi:hypothetical protein
MDSDSESRRPGSQMAGGGGGGGPGNQHL